jgi:hypothetical protein
MLTAWKGIDRLVGQFFPITRDTLAKYPIGPRLVQYNDWQKYHGDYGH